MLPCNANKPKIKKIEKKTTTEPTQTQKQTYLQKSKAMPILMLT